MATTEIVKLRRQVLVELSKLAYQGDLKEKVKEKLNIMKIYLHHLAITLKFI